MELEDELRKTASAFTAQAELGMRGDSVLTVATVRRPAVDGRRAADRTDVR
jgi:hypothetical protein